MHASRPPGRAYEHELTETVRSGTDRWLTELRLAVIGIIISVALGAADIALSLSGWEVALVAGIASTLVFIGILWQLRPQTPTQLPLDEDLARVGREVAELRTSVDENPDPTWDLLDGLAAAAEHLGDYLDRIAEEAYLATDSSGALRRVRAYDAELYELKAEIRCLRAKSG